MSTRLGGALIIGGVIGGAGGAGWGMIGPGGKSGIQTGPPVVGAGEEGNGSEADGWTLI